jgi:tetratricopeptide (TPR) repeat protein
MNGAHTKAQLATALISVVLVLSSCARDAQKAKAKYVDFGKQYMKQGQYGDAAIEFRNALRLDPRFVDAYYQLAQAYIAQQEWGAAFDSLEKAIQVDPSRLDARLDRGRLYLAARQFDNAQEEGDFVLKRNSREVGAYQLIGAALIGEQKPDQALTAFSKVTELLPNDVSAYLNMALAEISLRRFTDAERDFKKAIEVDPKAVQAYTDLANFYRLQNRIGDAEQILQAGVAKNPGGIPLYIDWASMMASQGNGDGADSILDKLRKQVPTSSEAAVSIGDFFFQRQQTDRALAEYRRGLSSAPKNLAIKKRIQDVYLSTSQTALAAGLDAELRKDAPKDIIVRVDQGRLLMAQGKVQDAIRDLQQVVADAADSAPAHYFLAMAYWQNGNTGQAHRELVECLRISPALPGASLGLVRLSLAQGDAAEAQIYAEELTQRFPANKSNHLLLAEALAQKRELQAAEKQVLIAKQLDPKDPTVHLDLARIYSEQKKMPEAQNEFEAALRLDQDDTKALAQFADFLNTRSQSARALGLVQQYVSSNPNNANGHVILGTLDFERKSYSSAQAEFDRAIQIDPKDAQAYVRLGKLYEAEGRTDLAIAPYRKALDLQPNAPLATLVGNLYLDEGDLKTARKYYVAALDADPNYAIATANVAWVDTQENRDLNVALSMAQKARSMEPGLPSITDTLAWVMYKQGNYAGALPLLQQCVQTSPDSAEFRFHLGMTLMATGKKVEGKEQLEAALRMKLADAETQQAHQMLAQVN